MRLKIIKARTKVIPIVLALSIFTPVAAEARWNIAVTNPWLAALVAFIGGVNVKVVPLSGWNKEGEIVKFREKDLDATKKAMAMDRKEIKSFRGSLGESARVEILYRDFPDSQNLAQVFSDPGTLPFIGQRVLVAMADLDPQGYEYYQRRLAEFQSRLDSTVSMGRKLLAGASILDLSGSQDRLFRATGCTVTHDDGKVRAMVDEVLTKKRAKERDRALGELIRSMEGYDALLLDYRSGLQLSLPPGAYPIVVVRPLDVDVDPVSALYDRYLAVWNVLRNVRD
ncbi:hypothetical protein [Dethiosulfovibrio salsuginis]|uniref:Uncharacterized protein n=1 Tax=Dethiosulfovibrio salsuginis TaxID=561720 RepID=A0A1X7IA58_9BACT|nr:hypothetical protein [Dethiosulfovibrio salsuginis]SMG10836.1 hypothetical protein SAMN06275492_101225 [Dethiosulfovibrio salsuginis]